MRRPYVPENFKQTNAVGRVYQFEDVFLKDAVSFGHNKVKVENERQTRQLLAMLGYQVGAKKRSCSSYHGLIGITTASLVLYRV